jgi:hypothetical protein
LATLYNSGAKSVAETADATPEQIAAYGQSATAAPAARVPTGRTVTIISPHDGKAYETDEAYLADAVAQGYKPESAEHAGIRKYVAENKGISGAAKIALEGLIDEGTFGVGGVIADSARDPYELAKHEALKADHQVANLTGRAAGFGLSLLYGAGEAGLFTKAGKLGLAAERAVLGGAEKAAGRAIAADMAYRGVEAGTQKIGSGIARKILASGANYGVQGLALSAPKAMAQLITGDPERAAETWIYGAAGGAGLGALAGVGGSIAGKLLSREAAAVEDVATGTGLRGKAAAKLREYGDDQALSALDMTKPLAKKLRRIKGMDDAVAITREADLSKYAGDVEGMAGHVTELWHDAGKKIGEIRKAGGDKELIDFDDMFETLLKPARDAQKGMGKRGAGETVEDWLKKEILAPLSEKWIDSHGPGMVPKKGLNLEEMHEVRRIIDGATKWDSTVSAPVNELRKEIRSAVNEALESKMKKAGDDLGKELLPAWKEANRRYQVLSVMKENAINNLDRGLANRRHSLTDYLGNQVGSVVGGFTGGGIGSIVGGYIGGEANSLLRRYAPAYLSKGAHAAADMLEGRGMVQLEDAFGQHGRQLANIPTAIERLSSGARHPVRETMGVNILTRFLGAEDAKLDDNEGLMAFADKLASLSSDPAKLQQNIEAATADLTGDAPEVAIAAGLKLQQAAQYLHSKAPKPPSVPGPFDPPSHWQPTSAQARDFRTRVATAKDPYVAIDALTDGSLTKAHVETLQALAPKIYQEMVRKVIEHGASGKAKPLPYAERLRLSMLTGAPLDRSLEQIASYQQTFATADPQGKPSKLKGPQLGTDIQRISNS